MLGGDKTNKYSRIAEQIRTLVIEYIKGEKFMANWESHDELEEFEERDLKSKAPQSLKSTRYLKKIDHYYFSNR